MWNKEYVAQEKADNQKTHSYSLKSRKPLDENGEVHIMTVRMFYKKRCESGGQILTSTVGKANCQLTLDKNSEPHIITIRQSILADLVPLTDQ